VLLRISTRLPHHFLSVMHTHAEMQQRPAASSRAVISAEASLAFDEEWLICTLANDLIKCFCCLLIRIRSDVYKI
jgi:hypothetical protein